MTTKQTPLEIAKRIIPMKVGDSIMAFANANEIISVCQAFIEAAEVIEKLCNNFTMVHDFTDCAYEKGKRNGKLQKCDCGSQDALDEGEKFLARFEKEKV